MNPEEIQELLQEVIALRAQGVSDREINSAFRRYGVPVENLAALESTARNLGIEVAPLRESEDGELSSLRALAPLVQGFTGSLTSDVLDLLERGGIGQGSAQFRRNLESAREEAPLSSAAMQVAGAVAGGPRILAQKALVPATRAAAGVAGRGAAALAGRMGAGPAGQLGAQGVGRGIGGLLSGAALGGAEGAAIEFGETAGQEDRSIGLFGPAVGAATGGLAGGIGQAVGHARDVARQMKGRGLELAEAAETSTRGLPNRRGIASRVETADAARREAFGQFDQAGREIPEEITSFVRTDPTARQALRQSRSQEAREFERGLRAFEAGEGPMPSISATLADELRKDLGHVADSFARRTPTSSGRVPSATATREAAAAEEALTGLLENVDGFQAGMQATRLARSTERAFNLGTQSRNVGADVIEDLMAGKSVRIGQRGSRAQSLPDTPEAREAFRAGLLRPTLLRLRQGTESVDGFLTRLTTGTEEADKLRIALGGEENLRAFMREAERVKALGDVQGFTEMLIKYAGFTTLGSSLAGGAAVGLLNR